MNFKKPFKVLTTAALIGTLSLSAVAPGASASSLDKKVSAKAETKASVENVVLKTKAGELLTLQLGDYLEAKAAGVDFNGAKPVSISTNGKYYSLDDYLEAKASTTNKTEEEAFKLLDGSEQNIKPVEGQINKDGSVTPKDEATGDFKVTEVAAINGKQIKVTFNKSVDKKSALDVTNYTIKPATTAVKTISSTSTDANYASAVLSEDKKSVTITFKSALNAAPWTLVDGDVFNFNYADVKTANSSETLKGTEVVKYSDKVAPEFVSAKASAKTATSDVTLTFSEPVDTAQALVSINGTYASFTAGSTPNEVVATFTGLDLEAGKSYDMTILNVKDAAGNLIADNNKKVSVKVDADATAPAVTDVKAVSDSKVELTFDKKVSLASAKTAGAIKFVDGNLASLGTVDSTNITVKANTDGKTLVVPFSAVSFTKGTVTGNLVLTDAITDASGNKLPATSKSLTLTQDVAAPTVVSAKYVNKTTYGDQTSLTNGAIVVKFSEDVAASAATTAYTVVDNKGNVVTTAFGTPVVNGDDESELILPLNAGIDTTLTSYKVVLPTSAVTDLALTPNASKSVNLNVDITAGAVVTNDTTAPTATVTETAATTSDSGTKFAVVFNEAVNTDTVTDVNNYRLNGLPLADGTYITYNSGTKTATINVPAGSIAKSAANYTLNISGVKDLAGNAINASSAVFDSLTLVDDVAPELKTATLNSVGQVVLGFSEALSAIDEGDFVVKVNGTATTDFTITPGTGSDTGKYILTVNDGGSPAADLDLTKAATSSVTVQAKNASTTKDDSALTNVLADSKVITVK